jgi:hypothetical protein
MWEIPNGARHPVHARVIDHQIILTSLALHVEGQILAKAPEFLHMRTFPNLFTFSLVLPFILSFFLSAVKEMSRSGQGVMIPEHKQRLESTP